MDLFNRTGKMALGSRLRLLTAKITEEADKIYKLYKVDFSPKWFPVFFVLYDEGAQGITSIAEQIGHSQPSVTKIVKEMAKAGLVKDNLRSKDKRKNVADLTEKGKYVAAKMITIQGEDIDKAIDGIIAEATHNLWEAIGEWEFLLEQRSLLKRVEEQKKLRESQEVQIVEYEPKYKAIFKALNEEWITTYFEIEETDKKALNNPEEYILNKGGKIIVALYKNEPLGVCALIKMDDPEYDYEMAKMAVSPKAQGKNMGWLMGQHIVNTARQLGATKIYLESNTLLKPAISLYYKMGFQKIQGHPTPYQRANIQMELDLTQNN
ncbi:bifunctional helix-turn-helix transcriptional regulator/GNAT family N-acetyltransferase [Myroides indicus]|uniref:MarR family transcriptional regulator with acetyltransferase activity n=1 Tax=Myroides indicus TaxID=1323422 RepID=A0A4R7EYX0_9FLAO|nr:helix-turn-helix domain-containing GNAT family N-acetyltransferase [Myroides indicus]TDS55265.1 MarR family transcriptional regulator with acetyltransferase activity [Myroides indicus]